MIPLESSENTSIANYFRNLGNIHSGGCKQHDRPFNTLLIHIIYNPHTCDSFHFIKQQEATRDQNAVELNTARWSRLPNRKNK